MSKKRLFQLVTLVNVAGSILLGLGIVLWTPDLPRATVEAQYLQQPGDLAEVAGTTVHLRDSGPRDGPPVILIHGFGSSLHTWNAWAAALESDRRVIRFDLPGHGLSPADRTGDYSDARVMAVVIGIMDRLAVRRADFVGNSIGGRIAFTFAATHPERVRKLVLVSPDGYESPGFRYGVAPEVPMVAGAMRLWLPRPLLRLTLGAAFADSAAVTEPLVSRYYDLIRAPGVRAAMLERMRQTVLVPPEPLLARVKAPVLLLWGEEDALIPVSTARGYVRALPHVQTVLLPQLGHVPQEEGPERSLRPVRAFLDA
ncbi:alpha/beta fold hydrolase [Cereibacter changlensis]|uniref:Alpha/beta fold hydrolase n=1 Tax=Cereibacter changlensis TaxID=402884 RepID=A0A4U0YY85_9RHOB|nr:alpha/beta fold hydrolase [Cereibacter changlensis]TKA97830.1 alpha/beta fold hydrolase [Cereibacter changlensis]